MRIDQLTEEYTSEGRTVPEDVDLETALLDFYKRNMTAGTYVSWLALDGDKIVVFGYHHRIIHHSVGHETHFFVVVDKTV